MWKVEKKQKLNGWLSGGEQRELQTDRAGGWRGRVWEQEELGEETERVYGWDGINEGKVTGHCRR